MGAIFFSGAFRVDLGLAYMGIYICAVTLLLFLVYFPDLGGMLLKPGAIKYNPQLIKPPAGYLGADVLNLDGLKTATRRRRHPRTSSSPLRSKRAPWASVQERCTPPRHSTLHRRVFVLWTRSPTPRKTRPRFVDISLMCMCEVVDKHLQRSGYGK